MSTDHCPACGHHLSMFTEPEPDRGERAADRVAAVVASWWFPMALIAAVLTWVGVNIIFRPFEPHPTLMLSVLAATLATTAACQGPLILLAQRRDAMRDRARDRETYLVASRTEGDLHDLIERMGRLEDHLDRGSDSPGT